MCVVQNRRDVHRCAVDQDGDQPNGRPDRGSHCGNQLGLVPRELYSLAIHPLMISALIIADDKYHRVSGFSGGDSLYNQLRQTGRILLRVDGCTSSERGGCVAVDSGDGFVGRLDWTQNQSSRSFAPLQTISAESRTAPVPPTIKVRVALLGPITAIRLSTCSGNTPPPPDANFAKSSEPMPTACELDSSVKPWRDASRLSAWY